jgi:hypothetical protein
VRWNKKENKVKVLNNLPEAFKGKEHNYSGLKCFGGHVWAFPYEANMVLKINPVDGTINQAVEFGSVCGDIGNDTFPPQNCIFVQQKNGKILLHTGATSCFVEYDIASRGLETYDILFAPAVTPANMEAGADMPIFETARLGLTQLIDCARHREKNVDIYNEKHGGGKSGAAIYKYCKEAVLKG